MLIKSTLCAGIALGALFGSFASSQAQTDGNAFDSCKPHDWLAYAEAVEAWDHEALNALILEPTFRNCEPLLASAQAIICDGDPLSCLQPAAGGDPDDQPGDDIPNDNPGDDDQPGDRPDGPFPGQAPGEQLGTEQDRADNSTPGDDGGNGGGGNGGGGAAPGGTPTGKP